MAAPAPTIRLATAADIGQVAALLSLMAKEFPVCVIDEVKALSQIGVIIREGLVIVVEIDGVIVASSALILEEWFCSNDCYMTDYWTFVHPRYRASKAANVLLKGIRDLAHKTKIPTFVDIRTFNQANRKNALYRRYFKPVGEKFYVGPAQAEA